MPEGPDGSARQGTPAPDPYAPKGPQLTSAPDGVVFYAVATAAPVEHEVFALFLGGPVAGPGVWAPDTFLPVQPADVEGPPEVAAEPPTAGPSTGDLPSVAPAGVVLDDAWADRATQPPAVDEALPEVVVPATPEQPAGPAD